MKLGRFSQALIFVVICIIFSAFIGIHCYDAGYKEGQEKAIEIFLAFRK